MNKTRINKYDNLKGFAILLIVFGHINILNPMPGDIPKILFLFDLPIFFFVAGYFSKIDSEQPIKSFKRLMVPYFIFCLLIELFRLFYVGSMNWQMIFIQSSVGLWFLVSLFIMKMILPVMDRLRYPVITAFLFALLFGLFDIHPNLLGLTRTFAYLPIFLLGFYFNSYRESFIKDHPKLYGFYDRHFWLFLIILVIVTAVVIFKFDSKYFVFKEPYSMALMKDVIKRFIVLVLEMMWVAVFNRIMTDRECFLTQFGRNSMAVYVLHLFLLVYIKPIRQTIAANNLLLFAFSLALTFAVVYVLSRDVVSEYLNRFTDGVFDLLVKPAGD